jgi:hypothetical protein
LEADVSIKTVATPLIGVALVLALARPSAAQAPATGQNRVEIGVSYSYLHLHEKKRVQDPNANYDKGWNIFAGYRVSNRVTMITEFDGYPAHDTGYYGKIYSYMGGARFDVGPTTPVKTFVQFLFGGTQNEDRTVDPIKVNHQSGLFVGGGVDLPLAKSLAVRVQGDYMLMLKFKTYVNGARFGIGAVIPFGTKK